MKGIEIPIGAPLGQLDRDLKGANSKLKGFATQANSSVSKFASNTTAVMGVAAASIAAAFSVNSIIDFTKSVFAATAQFQKFEAVLGNTLGSSALASLKLKEISDFAAKTPFSVNELTASFVKLANAGFKPTGDEMRKLGDLASSTGKSFDQLAEAILDAQSGEFERLKEFGIRAQDAGDKVIFTFKGVKTEVDKSSTAIRDYITALGNAEGVSGSMAVISETLGGKISNLGDSWDQMLISVGGNTEGVFSSVISIVSKAVDAITGFNSRLELVNKFKLKQDFGLNFQGGSLKLSDVKTEVQTVENAQKSVSKYIKSIQEIAKTPEEFKSAIKSLIEINREAVSGLNNNNVAKAITAQFQDGVNILQDLAKESAPKDAGFGKKGKEGKSIAEQRADLLKDLSSSKKDNFLTGLEQNQSVLKNQADVIAKSLKQGIKQNLKGEPLISMDSLFGKGFSLSDLVSRGELYTPFQILKDEINFDLLPQLGSSFKTFFDDMLMNGTFSFEKLGQSIKSTFASVLASEATNGLLKLLGSKGGSGGSGGGLIKAVGGVLGIGGKAAAAATAASAAASAAAAGSLAGVAASTGGVILGSGLAAGGTTAAALASGTVATGGLLLPVLAGAAALAGIALLFKKKQTPLPAQQTNSYSSAAISSNSDFGGGRVVFEISGTNLIGVLNRAGAKLQRFGP